VFLLLGNKKLAIYSHYCNGIKLLTVYYYVQLNAIQECHVMTIVVEGEYDIKRHQMHNGVVDDMQMCHVAVLYCDSAVSVGILYCHLGDTLI